MRISEQYTVACMFIDSDVIGLVSNKLKPEMFEDDFYREFYTEMLKAYDIGKKHNVPSITQALESERFPSKFILNEIMNFAKLPVTPYDVRTYADVVISEYKKRALLKMLNTIIPDGKRIDKQIGELMNELEALLQNKDVDGKSLKDIVSENEEKYFCEHEGEKIYTGFEKLDEITGGLEGGDTIVIGARPGVGKSALTNQIILQMARTGKRIGLFNLEMSNKQIYERAVSSQSAIGLRRIRRAKRFLGDEQEKFQKANEELKKLDVMVFSGSKTVSEIRNLSRNQQFDCIMIDYLQLVKSDVRYSNRASEVGAISKAIKGLAMELNIPIVILSQLNRVSEMRETKEPTMAELREAGDIEQDASIIILLWNLDEERERKGLKVDKNRQGEAGKIVMRFDGNEMKFIETNDTITEESDTRRTPFD